MRVLIVDDDRKAAQILARGLREERFVVDVASTAEQGDEMATATDYDLIVLDWLLPEQDALTSLVDVHVSHLRRKVDGSGGPPLIHTIRGRGYLVGPAAE